MNIIQENAINLTASLKIHVVAEDYAANVEKAMKDLQKKAQMPGFRPGKVPMGIVKKLYGKGVLVEEVNKVITDGMYDYIKSNNLNILGSPMPVDEKNEEVNWDEQNEFEFHYELGLAPVINLNIEEGIEAEYHKIKIEESIVDDSIKDILRRNGKMIEPEVSEDADVLFGKFQESDGEGNLLENGVENSASLYLEYLKDEDVKKSLVGLKTGDSLTIDLEKAVKDDSEMSRILGVKKDELVNYSKNYMFTVERISRMEPAELNETLYNTVAPNSNITTEQEFRDYVASQVSNQYQNEVDRNFRNEAIKVVLKKANLELPEEFLKKWLLATNRDNKELTAEQVEKEFVSMVDSFKWQLIEDYLAKKYSVEVKQEEVDQYLKNYITGQLVQYGQTQFTNELLDSFVDRMKSNKEEVKKVYDTLFDSKILQLLKEKLTLKQKELTFDEFIKEMTDKYTSKQTEITNQE